MLLYAFQTLQKVKVYLLPWQPVIFGLTGSPVFIPDPSSSGYSDGRNGWQEQLVRLDGAQQPHLREPCEFAQGHFRDETVDSSDDLGAAIFPWTHQRTAKIRYE